MRPIRHIAPGSPVVIVVDDDASVRKALHRLLGSAGCAVETFGTVAEFIERPQPPAPDCLILDIRMPGMDGLALQRRFAHERPELPVILITAHGGPVLRRRALAAGAIDVLDKPFDERSVLDAIARAVGRPL